jgi:hypothetical protein
MWGFLNGVDWPGPATVVGKIGAITSKKILFTSFVKI